MIGTEKVDAADTKLSLSERIRHSFDEFRGDHVKALFSTPRLAWSTSLVIFCYASLGLAYPLFNGFLGGYLAAKNAALARRPLTRHTLPTRTRRHAVCREALSPRSLSTGPAVDAKFAMAFFTIMSGVFLFALTQAKNEVQVNALVAIAAFWQNAFCAFVPLDDRGSWLIGQTVCCTDTHPRCSPPRRAEPVTLWLLQPRE